MLWVGPVLLQQSTINNLAGMYGLDNTVLL